MNDPIPSMNRIRCTQCGEEFALQSGKTLVATILNLSSGAVGENYGYQQWIRCPKCNHEEEIM